jgi:DNA-directed RNA polymerase subunit RPC12/RpoP
VKKVIVPIVLVAGIGLSIYLWSTMDSADAGDKNIMTQAQKYTCAACKQEFQLTVDESREMRRARGDIFCPHCGAASAAKHDVKINMGGPTLGSGDSETEEQATDEASNDPAPPKPSGGAQKIN